jgi:uncharacterized protein (DUF362 family)/NAD-dependent dihydropyrimidine dehydrogenase PreA subunit
VSNMSIVSAVGCETYALDPVRQGVRTVLAPLGGIDRFVRPGMRVLLKPNLVRGADEEQAITTHPSVVQAMAELVQQAGGTVLIGDSPGGPADQIFSVWRKSRMAEVAENTGATLVRFDDIVWKRLDGQGYFLARVILEADLVINLPKLKTHILTLYTGGIKNLFGAIPGTRKREVHCRAPGVVDFSQALVDVLELVPTGLTIMDGVLGLEGNGPGVGGDPRLYGCLAASVDPVALDATITMALGYGPGEVLHVAQADARKLGTGNPEKIRVEGDRRVLDFGRVVLPKARWIFRVPSWVGPWVSKLVRVHPWLEASLCVGCGDCVEVCPQGAITSGHPPVFDLDNCINCFCCAEICPQGAITPHRNLLAQLIGLGY